MNARHRCDQSFEVVFVCTANRARSPLAEALFRRYVSEVDAVVRSAGTLGVESAPALKDAIEAGLRHGVDLTDHRAQPLRSASVASADLVIGFEQPHVAAAVVEGGACPDRAFLLGELTSLLPDDVCGEDPCRRARIRVAQADSRRVRARPHPSTQLIADPYGKPAKVMNRTAKQIDRLVDDLAAVLFGIERQRTDRARRFRRARGRQA